MAKCQCLLADIRSSCTGKRASRCLSLAPFAPCGCSSFRDVLHPSHSARFQNWTMQLRICCFAAMIKGTERYWTEWRGLVPQRHMERWRLGKKPAPQAWHSLGTVKRYICHSCFVCLWTLSKVSFIYCPYNLPLWTCWSRICSFSSVILTSLLCQDSSSMLGCKDKLVWAVFSRCTHTLKAHSSQKCNLRMPVY